MMKELFGRVVTYVQMAWNAYMNLIGRLVNVQDEPVTVTQESHLANEPNTQLETEVEAADDQILEDGVWFKI